MSESRFLRDPVFTSFFSVYCPDNMDKNHFWKILINSPCNQRYYMQPWVLVTNFLGLPNQPRAENSIPFLVIVKNFLDWDDELGFDSFEDQAKKNMKIKTNIYKNIHNIFINCITLKYVFKLVSIVFKAALNIARLFTEFLPTVCDAFCIRAAENAKTEENKPLEILAHAGSVFFTGLKFVLRSLTSPLENITVTWRRIKGIASGKKASTIPFINSLLKDNPPLAKGLGIFFGLLSAAITITAAVILLPLTIKACGGYAAIHAPKVIADAFSAVNVVISHFGGGLGNVLGKVGIVFASSASQLGASVLAGLSVVTGLAVKYAANKIENVMDESKNIKSQPAVSLGKRILNFFGSIFEKKPEYIPTPPTPRRRETGDTEKIISVVNNNTANTTPTAEKVEGGKNNTKIQNRDFRFSPALSLFSKKPNSEIINGNRNDETTKKCFH